MRNLVLEQGVCVRCGNYLQLEHQRYVIAILNVTYNHRSPPFPRNEGVCNRSSNSYGGGSRFVPGPFEHFAKRLLQRVIHIRGMVCSNHGRLFFHVVFCNLLLKSKPEIYISSLAVPTRIGISPRRSGGSCYCTSNWTNSHAFGELERGISNHL